MNARARRLPEYTDARGRAHAQYGTRLVRKRCALRRVAADATGADVRSERVECTA